MVAGRSCRLTACGLSRPTRLGVCFAQVGLAQRNPTFRASEAMEHLTDAASEPLPVAVTNSLGDTFASAYGLRPKPTYEVGSLFCVGRISAA